jgi:hypothetical protein
MASIIKIKRKQDAAGAPSSLEDGEIALNLFTRKLYAGNSTGVTAIGGVTGFAADILTEIKTVDGASSGLDADLLDGQQGTYYAVAATENSRLANTNAFIATKTTESTALSRLANTNTYIATKLNSSSYTAADVKAKAALANTNAYIATTAATERSSLANTNSYIATTAATERSSLANTNAFIATKLNSSSYTAADVKAKAALANTNAFIATKTTESTALSRLANTNSYIATVKTIAVNRLGQTSTIALTGDVTASATAFSSNTASLATTIAANSVDGSQLEDNITIANNLTVSGNTHIDGNLTVEGGTTYLSTSTVYTDDGMMKLNANNAADTVDSGIYNKYIVSSTAKYAGYFRDASDSGVFKFYKDLQAEPDGTVNVGGTGYALAQVDAIIDGGTY